MMKKKSSKGRTTILLIVLFISTCLVAKTDFDSIKTDYIEVDDINRSYSYYIPKDVTKSPKLLFVLHGSKMDTQTMIEATGFEFNIAANTLKNMIIVYPQGYEKAWNDCRKSVTNKAHTLNLNEMKFFKKIISSIESKNKIKTNSIFVVGFSNGGHLVYKLAKQNPEFFKGFGAIGATLPVSSNDSCEAKNKPVNILVANGTKDPVSSFNGSQDMISTFDTIEYYKNLMRCKKTIETNHQSSDISINKNFCKNSNKTVTLVKIEGGGHVIPNPNFSKWPKNLGKVSKDIDLPNFIIDFFKSINH